MRQDQSPNSDGSSQSRRQSNEISTTRWQRFAHRRRRWLAKAAVVCLVMTLATLHVGISLCIHLGPVAKDGAIEFVLAGGGIGVNWAWDQMPQYPGLVSNPGLHLRTQRWMIMPFPFILADDPPPGVTLLLPVFTWGLLIFGTLAWIGFAQRTQCGRCQCCEYDLSGLQSPTCPECGHTQVPP